MFNLIPTKITKDLTFIQGNFTTIGGGNPNSNSSQENNHTLIPNFFVNFKDYMNETLLSYNNNQFYNLLKNLIKVKSWENCDFIFGILENFYDPIGSSELVNEVCDVLKMMISNLYNKSGFEIKLKIKAKENNLSDNIIMENNTQGKLF